MSPAGNRDEHLAWAKQRALQYLDAGNMSEAYASMSSDLNKHDELRGIGEKMRPVGMLYLMNRDERNLRNWIEGFR